MREVSASEKFAIKMVEKYRRQRKINQKLNLTHTCRKLKWCFYHVTLCVCVCVHFKTYFDRRQAKRMEKPRALFRNKT